MKPTERQLKKYEAFGLKVNSDKEEADALTKSLIISEVSSVRLNMAMKEGHWSLTGEHLFLFTIGTKAKETSLSPFIRGLGHSGVYASFYRSAKTIIGEMVNLG